MDRPWMKYYDSDIDVGIEYFHGNMYEQLRKVSDSVPGHTALDYYGITISYELLMEHIDKAAAVLAGKGLKKGDCVLFATPNTPGLVVLLYAALKLGLIIAITDRRSSVASVRNALRFNSCKALFINAPRATELPDILEGTNVKDVVLIGIGDYLNFRMRLALTFKHMHMSDIMYTGKLPVIDGVDIELYDTFLNSEAPETEFDPPREDDIAIRFGRGAAAGDYKPEEFSHFAFCANVENIRLAFGIEDPSKSLNLEKQYKSFAAIDNNFSTILAVSIHSFLCLGLEVMIVPVYSPKGFTRAVVNGRPDIIIGYPDMFISLMEVMRNEKRFDRVSLSFIEECISIGSVFNPVKLREFNEFLERRDCSARVRVGYGLTECLSVCSLNPDKERRTNSIGIPFPGVLMKITDPKTLTELGPNGQGEICVCTPTVFTNCADDKEAYDKLIRKHRDGRYWLHTGDIGHMDEDGFFYFDYAEKRCAKIGGMSVALKTVEDVISNVYGVSDVCVVDYTDEAGVNRLIAVVVPEDAFLFDNDKLNSLENAINIECEQMLLRNMRPYAIEYRVTLPKRGLNETDYKAVAQDVTESRIASAERAFGMEDKT